MSDIVLRLDGLVLMLVLAASAAVLATVAIGLLAAALLRRRDRERLRRKGRAVVVLCVAAVVAFGAVLSYTELVGQPMSGPDLIDWLAVPWLIFLVGGIVRIWRLGPDTPVAD